MAISIDWGTKVISVPKADTQLVQASPTEIRQLDIDVFRLELKSLEDSEDGMPFPDTHLHNAEVTVGGVTLAMVVEIINGYTITFEDGQYAVNLVGANSNISDVANVNQVSIRSANSAGLTFSDEINKQSFQGGVVYVNDAGLSGTQFPRGTPSDPVNNLADAKIIADNNGFSKFELNGSFCMTEDMEEYSFFSTSQDTCSLDFCGYSINHSVFQRLTIAGGGTGNFNAYECTIPNGYVGIDASVADCILAGVFVVAAGEYFTTDRCNAGAGIAISVNGTGSCTFANFSGIVQVENATDPSCVVAVTGTHITYLMPSCTNGQALIGGHGILVNYSSIPSVTDMMVSNAVWGAQIASYLQAGSTGEALNEITIASIADAVWDEATSEHQDAGSTGKAITDAGAAGNPWSADLSSNNTPGTFGEAVNKIKKWTSWLRSLL